jgi:hypothetical protein
MFYIAARAIVPVIGTALNGQAIVQAWKDNAAEIAQIEHTSISDRTPEWTGTLDASLTESLNPDSLTIMQVYTDPAVQLAGPWERVYAQYQETPPLGHTTYTRTTPHYVYDAATEDLGQIAAWANKTAASGVQTMVSAVGVTTIP